MLSASIVSSTQRSLGLSSHFQLWLFSLSFQWQQEPGPSLAPLRGLGSKSTWGTPRTHAPLLPAQPVTVFCPIDSWNHLGSKRPLRSSSTTVIDIAEKSSPRLLVILLMYLCFPSPRPHRTAQKWLLWERVFKTVHCWLKSFGFCWVLPFCWMCPYTFIPLNAVHFEYFSLVLCMFWYLDWWAILLIWL